MKKILLIIVSLISIIYFGLFINAHIQIRYLNTEDNYYDDYYDDDYDYDDYDDDYDYDDYDDDYYNDYEYEDYDDESEIEDTFYIADLQFNNIYLDVDYIKCHLIGNDIKINCFSSKYENGVYENDMSYAGDIDANHLSGVLDITITYYDANFEKICDTSDTIELLGEGFPNTSFNIITPHENLNNKKAVYYQVKIDRLELDNE